MQTTKNGFTSGFQINCTGPRLPLDTKTNLYYSILWWHMKGLNMNLKKSHAMASADGKPLQELGKANFVIKLGKLNFETELIVEDIDDEALLDLDILMKAE